jgi:hypothetical protein
MEHDLELLRELLRTKEPPEDGRLSALAELEGRSPSFDALWAERPELGRAQRAALVDVHDQLAAALGRPRLELVDSAAHVS